MTDTPASEGGAASCVPWGFWTTTGVGLLAVAAWAAVQLLAVVAVSPWLRIGTNASEADIDALTSHGLLIAVVSIVSTPAPIAVVALAARLARCSIQDYLALYWPDRRNLLIGIACLVVLLPLGDLSSYLTGRDIVPSFVVDAYRTARGSGHLMLLAIALVVAAPLMEELLFRGFLLPGFAASRLGISGAIVLTSVTWAAMHVQYELFYIIQIFILGCVLGWLRWRSGSTTLTLMLHALVNLGALLQVAYIVERTA